MFITLSIIYAAVTIGMLISALGKLNMLQIDIKESDLRIRKLTDDIKHASMTIDRISHTVSVRSEIIDKLTAENTALKCELSKEPVKKKPKH